MDLRDRVLEAGVMPVLVKLMGGYMRCISAERPTEDIIGVKKSAADKTDAIKTVRNATWVLGKVVEMVLSLSEKLNLNLG